MLELRTSNAAVVSCLAAPSVLDGLRPPSAAGCYRVAPGELLVIGPAATRARLTDEATAAVRNEDPGALIVDATDGWSVVTITGSAVQSVLTRLTTVKPPPSRPAFIQAAFAEVPAKAIVLSDALHVLVESTAAHHVRQRVLAACADLGVREIEPAELGPLDA